MVASSSLQLESIFWFLVTSEALNVVAQFCSWRSRFAELFSSLLILAKSGMRRLSDGPRTLHVNNEKSILMRLRPWFWNCKIVRTAKHCLAPHTGPPLHIFFTITRDFGLGTKHCFLQCQSPATPSRPSCLFFPSSSRFRVFLKVSPALAAPPAL